VVYHDASREGVISCWPRGAELPLRQPITPGAILRHRDDRRKNPDHHDHENTAPSSPRRRADPAEASSPSAPVPYPDVVTLNARQQARWIEVLDLMIEWTP
jgi:hypothetical protein